MSRYQPLLDLGTLTGSQPSPSGQRSPVAPVQADAERGMHRPGSWASLRGAGDASPTYGRPGRPPSGYGVPSGGGGFTVGSYGDDGGGGDGGPPSPLGGLLRSAKPGLGVRDPRGR
jgi:hypothetical protein